MRVMNLLARNWANRGMSSVRSRSGGSAMRKDVEPVKEILAKGLFAHRLEQIAVAGGNDPNVDLNRRAAADPLTFALLQHAEELGLNLEGDFTDLVEEDRAAVGQLEAAEAFGEGAGEGAFFMAEQLTLHQARR